ncbi:hypothetical protein Daus18300_011004 [Diaporthe australafricana]|uniref:VWFA domain-containing protein n=1 Tax=Diaporthe australafricana TaxID=127596 RepID=A0ABR3W8R3_9PEZI
MAFLKKRDHTRSVRGQGMHKYTLTYAGKILVIDNSKYMRNFKDDVLRVFTNVAHILEAADPNGLDVVCISDPGNMQHSKTTERLIQFVRSNFDKGAHAPCFIEEALKILVDKVISKFPSGPGERRSLLSMVKSEKPRPISIYILTSGLWDSSPATKDSTCGAERPINQLINELKKRNLHKSQVAIQFIRFGDNETGKERLRYLDDSLGKPDQ